MQRRDEPCDRDGSAGEEQWLAAEVERERGETLLALKEFSAAEEAFRRADYARVRKIGVEDWVLIGGSRNELGLR